LAKAFAWAKDDHRIEHWRQQGMILAFDVKNNYLKDPKTFARTMFANSLDESALIRPISNTIYVMPPYILSSDETMQLGKAVQLALDKTLV
jgi:adenosylmethionine---8-amino-7-oxononanoate aminotransferase